MYATATKTNSTGYIRNLLIAHIGVSGDDAKSINPMNSLRQNDLLLLSIFRCSQKKALLRACGFYLIKGSARPVSTYPSLVLLESMLYIYIYIYLFMDEA